MNEFIRMSLAAQKELKDGWVPKVGDNIINKWGKQDVIIFVGGHPKHWRIGTVESRDRRLLPQELNIDNCKYIPNQENIQERLKPHFATHPHDFLLKNFIEYVFNITCISGGKYNPPWGQLERKRKNTLEFTITTLWLSFFMEIQYRRQWNIETGEWEMI